MASKNEVAETQNTAVGAFDYGEMSHEGFEDTTINDLSIPFLNVLQTNSPEVEDQTIEGCKAGDIVNSVTREIMKQPILFQPIFREEVWVEWKPRNQGGGLLDRHDPNGPVVTTAIANNGGSRIPPKGADGKRIPLPGPNDGELVETHYVYGYILDDDGVTAESYGVLAFSSTKIKIHKDWMTSMYTQKGRPPMFANRAAISTQKQKAEGGSFFNFKISPAFDTWRTSLINPNDEDGMKLLKDAQEFKKMIEEGLARPDYDSSAADHQTPPAGGGGGTQDMGDDAPF